MYSLVSVVDVFSKFSQSWNHSDVLAHFFSRSYSSHEFCWLVPERKVHCQLNFCTKKNCSPAETPKCTAQFDVPSVCKLLVVKIKILWCLDYIIWRFDSAFTMRARAQNLAMIFYILTNYQSVTYCARPSGGRAVILKIIGIFRVAQSDSSLQNFPCVSFSGKRWMLSFLSTLQHKKRTVW